MRPHGHAAYDREAGRKEALAARLARRSVASGDCLLFLGGQSGNGYCYIKVDGRVLPVHRVAWTLANGRQPVGEVHHTCHNHRCIRPEHLADATVHENRSEGARFRWRIWAEFRRQERIIAHLQIEMGLGD